jgi:hypothetical protein
MSDDMKILGEDGKPVQAEGAKAKMSRIAREKMQEVLSKIDDEHQLIIICTDLTGRQPTHVHIEGPSKDYVLLSGMCMTALKCAGMANQNS